MKMIGHQDKLVKEIGFSSVREKDFEEQTRPWFSSEKRTALPCLRCDEVGLRVVGRVLSRRFQNLPSAAKAAAFVAVFPARLKSCPFKTMFNAPAGCGEEPYQSLSCSLTRPSIHPGMRRVQGRHRASSVPDVSRSRR